MSFGNAELVAVQNEMCAGRTISHVALHNDEYVRWYFTDGSYVEWYIHLWHGSSKDFAVPLADGRLFKE